MRKHLAPLAVVALLATAAVAVAQQATPSPLKVTTSGKASAGKGTKAKPVPVSVSYNTKTATADGTRQETWKTIDNAWGGVVSRGDLFPTCTADKIDAAQSDKGCPKGSLVATGILNAVVGPANDWSGAGITCDKSVHIYNAGKGKIATILVGPADKCAGVGYVAPWGGEWIKKGGLQGGEYLKSVIPDNVSHPLPGIIGSTVETTITFKKLTVKAKGVTHGYVESVGCTGKRQYLQHILGDPSGKDYDTKGTAGTC